MIYTSNYKTMEHSDFKTISISKDKGEDAGYKGDVFLELAPKRDFFKKWKANKGIIPDIDNNKYYIEEFYNKVLKELDPKETYKKLDGLILLCYEDNMDFCHRHIVAGWFELLLGVDIKEVTVINKKLIEADKPRYIKEYLEELIRKEGRFK